MPGRPSTAPIFVELDGLVNFRDVGGYPAASGQTVATGRVYRSDGLHRLSPRGLEAAGALGVATVIDLRSAPERTVDPDPLPSVHVEVQERVDGDTDHDVYAIEGRDAGELVLRDLYVTLLERAAPRFGDVLGVLAAPGTLPAIVHCAGGKDRTGLTVALLLSAVGVDRELVLDDYAFAPGTAAHAARAVEVHGRFLELGVEGEAARGLLSTPRWAMADALASIDEAHGGVEAYLLGPAGLSPGALQNLRAAMLVEDRSRFGDAGARGRAVDA